MRPKCAQGLRDLLIGVFGAGHLGRALARGLLDAGLPAKQLLLCHGNSPATHLKIAQAGLEQFVAAPTLVAERAQLVLYTVRPQSCRAIEQYPLRRDCVFVSFLAGTPLSRIPIALPQSQQARVMPSAPDTILDKRGIAALFPSQSGLAAELLTALHLRLIPLASEEDFDAFTVLGPCLPIALTCWEGLGRSLDESPLLAAAQNYHLPDFGELLKWAQTVRPTQLSAEQRAAYLAQAATPGGVTEAILKAIQSGETLSEALERGIQRSRALRSA